MQQTLEKLAPATAEASGGAGPDAGAALDRLLRARRSVRAFRPDPVPEALLRRVLEMAQLSPSNCNVQPWVLHIVSGDAAERIRARLHETAASGTAPSPDIALTGAYPGAYRTRQIDAAKALFAASGVARDDIEARRHSFLRNFSFFGAPHAAFLFMPEWAGMREAADCGMFTQSFMLALTAHGLASCAQGALSHHASVVREVLGVAGDMRLLYGIAFGFEDPGHPVNATRTGRAPIDETTVFHA